MSVVYWVLIKKNSASMLKEVILPLYLTVEDEHLCEVVGFPLQGRYGLTGVAKMIKGLEHLT